MYRECFKKCPIQVNNKCLSGDGNKKFFGENCIEYRLSVIEYYKKHNIEWLKKGGNNDKI